MVKEAEEVRSQEAEEENQMPAMEGDGVAVRGWHEVPCNGMRETGWKRC